MSRKPVWFFALAVLPLAAEAAVDTPQRPAVQETSSNLPAQKIRPDDLIALSVYDAPELTRTVRVGRDGTIHLPMVQRHISVEGLMPSEVETAVAAELRSEEILVEPVVTVTVAEYGGRPLSVSGAVRNPITFQAVGRVTLLEALNRAGGLSPEAGPELLLTTTQPGPDGHPVALTQRIPVKALLDTADPDVNVILSGGEEIRVPEAGKIYVVGNIKKPGAFPAGDDAEVTVMKALALAEGVLPYTSKRAYIIRRNDTTGAKTELPVEIRKILDRKSPDVPLQASDILYVPDNSGRKTSMGALEKIAAFAASTISGVVIYSTIR